MKLLIPSLCLASFLGASLLHAQNTAAILPRPHPPRPSPPIIWIDPSQGKLKPLTIQAVDADIKVRGHIASTTMEITFYNPNSRVLEGELIFPLGEGQTVSGYALEVSGKLRQAVVVTKEKGREVFEEVVRRGIDPGLAEITKGNVFRTRVYPIPPSGTKRVAVSFEQELSGDGKGFRYLLPLAFTDKVERFHARAEVVKQENAPMPDADKNTESLTFEKWRDSFVAELTKENYLPDKPLAFTLPMLPNVPQVFMVNEKLDPAKMFFSLRVAPEVPPAPPLAAPKHIALFYDASGSAAKRDRKRENAFFKTWLKSLGEVTVELVAFRNDADKPVSFTVKNGDASDLLKAIEALPLDGGTSLGAVDVKAAPDADAVVLVSDGLTNFGPTEPKLARGEDKPLRVIALHAAQIVDAPGLERIVRKSGGRVVNLISMKDEDALKALNSTAFQFISAKVVSGKAEEIVPAMPEAVTNGFTLAGQFEGETEIELSFGYGGKVSVTRRVVLKPDEALEPERGDFVRRAWAQRKIAELMLDQKKNESAITALGMEHRIVTSGTSLIVLDRLEDYARHGIEPPELELREEYLAMRLKMPKDAREKDEAAHLDAVAKQWEEFKAWHEKKHPWLETVLKSAAEREAKLYAALSREVKGSEEKPKLSAQDAKAALELVEKAKDLAAGWNTEGREPKSRAVWVKDATQVMLAIEALRQRRLEAVPQSEDGGPGNVYFDGFVSGGASIGGGGSPLARGAGVARPMATSDPFSAPSPAAPPAPMTAARAPLSGEGRGGSKQAERPQSEDRGSALSGAIEVRAWNPDTPYLKKLRSAEDAYAAYLKERKDNANSSAFFLDCADFFRETKKDERIALRVLSNLAEMELESAPLLRILAYRLQQIGLYDLAVPLLEEVLKMRGEEPQSRRDLALALARMEKPDFSRAATLLWEVVAKNWDGRFPGVEVIALHELNDILVTAKAGAVDAEKIGIEKRFLDAVPVDLRVALTWDADSTDIDLWVIDPAGETCIFNHNRTLTGGHMSNDFTRGYGPEIFTIRRALPGTYTVKVNYYGNTQQKLAGATTVQVEFQTAFDQAGSKRQSVARRLTDKREVIEVGKFVFKPQPTP